MKGKNMICLLNSAVMPAGKSFDGVYRKTTITKEEFKKILQKNKDDYKSYIGYPNCARVIFDLCEIKVELCRDLWDLKLGDTALCMQLRYRVDPNEKGNRSHGDHADDYEYSKIVFTPA